ATKQYTFTWSGTNRDGSRMQGKTDGPNLATVKASLRQQGINPTRVRKKASLFGFGGGKRKRRIRPADIALFARQTSTMLAAGVSLVQSLDIIAKGSDNPALGTLV